MRTAFLVLTIAALIAPRLGGNPPEYTTVRAAAASSEWLMPLAPPHLADRLWPIPFGGRLGWATASTSNPQCLPGQPRVFLLRGSGMVFTPEYGTLCTRLRRAGLWAEDLRAVGDHWLCEWLIAEERAGRRQGPIILVGHSRGGRHILYAARELAKARVTVDLVVCLDVAMPPEVPGNVKHAVNVYLSGHRVYPAGTLVGAPGSPARIENLDLAAPNSPIDGHGLNHLNITASAAVQELVVERILHVARQAGWTEYR